MDFSYASSRGPSFSCAFAWFAEKMFSTRRAVAGSSQSPRTKHKKINMVKVRIGVLSIMSPAGPRYILFLLAAAAAAFIVLGCEAGIIDDGDHKYYNCNINNPSPCRKLLNISYPFSLKDDPRDCGGDPRYELSCEKNRTVLYFPYTEGKYYVEAISYENRTMRVVDSGLLTQNCSSLPLHPLTSLVNFTNSSSPFSEITKIFPGSYYYPKYEDAYFYPPRPGQENYIIFLNCESPIITSAPKSPHFVSTSPCINGSLGSHSYVVLGDLNCSDVPDSCTIGTMSPIQYLDDESGRHNRSFFEIHHGLAKGFELSWFRVDCRSCDKNGDDCRDTVDQFNNYIIKCWPKCRAFGIFSSRSCFAESVRAYFKNYVQRPRLKNIGYFTVVKTVFGYLWLSILVIYMLRRRHLSMDANIEEFLQEHNNLMLLQYSYSDIKKMTKHFRDKLGQGGFGSVYKGKLRSGNLVAIKMLAKSKGNGQDFINEVATIGRIHHVNVVQLIGFCFEGSKRALVYDFMPNGSLDKYIFSTQEQAGFSLSWEKMYKIALGVAHGIEYLHRGCDMQILHFDIKPHNILLNEDFTPKISDFGLAKLYPTNDNTVPLTGARGTMGYIAPELVYKSMGGVSYKADVYSFGMLLMEMAGRRKNVNPFANTSSQIYFPSWIYNKLNQGEDMEMEDATEEEKQIVRKMIIVALSCIQLKPADRPSMSRVIEMLESPTELLQMPPRPFLGSSFERVEEDQTIIEPSTTSLHSSSSSIYSLEIESN